MKLSNAIACSLVAVAAGGLLAAAPASAQGAACDYTKWRSLNVGYWPKTSAWFTYYFNYDTIPAQQPGTSSPYNRTRFARRILSGSRSWRYGRNRCGFYADGAPQIDFGGDTDSRAHEFEDDVSTVDLGGDINLRGTCPGPSKIACTHVTTRRLNGQRVIAEVDIRFNPRKRWWTGIRKAPADAPGNPYDLWSLAAHEWGHGIGFAHTVEGHSSRSEVRAQVMYKDFGVRERRYNLQGSDYTAMCAVYLGC